MDNCQNPNRKKKRMPTLIITLTTKSSLVAIQVESVPKNQKPPSTIITEVISNPNISNYKTGAEGGI
jgi:hypothetical protein